LIAAQTLLGLGLLIGWALIVDLEQVGRQLAGANLPLVLVGGLVSLITPFLRAARWRLVLKPLARVPLIEIWLVGLASSLINFVIPVRSGEVARSLFLKQRRGLPIAASLPTVVVDRSFDMLAVLILGATGALTGLALEGTLRTVLYAGLAVFLVFVTFVVLAIVSHQRILSLAERLLPRRLGEGLRRRVLGLVEGLLSGFTSLSRRPGDLVLMLALSLAAAVIDAGVFYLIFASLGARVPPMVVLTGYALFVVTFIIPGAPGYVGSMEAFGSLIFGALGAGQALAASMVVLIHALSALILGLSGGAAMWALGFSPAAALRAAGSTAQEAAPDLHPPAEPGSNRET
jgi:uncharacterized protein (TIRG00374 family)